MAATSSSWAEGNKRKISVVGTVGEVGASYSVYEKNWSCPSCKHDNFASRFRCVRCRTRKPEGTDNVVQDPALQQSGPMTWRETVDPQTQHLYYYNTATGETRWDRPAEMGHAPHASGWFGRGSTKSKVDEYNDRNKKYLGRPARKQKEYIEATRSIMEGGNEFNIWYGKHIGDQWDTGRGRLAAETKCDVEKDAGYTKADRSDAKNRFFCIHFARGMCARGADCQYFHRIPTVADDAAASELHDCFGRERHAKHRDDMDGVGSFTNPSRTLYVGGIQKSTYKSQEELERALWKHFGEFGEVEHLNFIPRLSIAFVRYRLRTNTEFAKEAMSNQKLDGDENLNLKWAYDDPNPHAKEAIKRADADAALALLQAQGVSLEQTEYDYPETYQMPATTTTVPGGASSSYPDTDAQYGTTTATPAAAAAAATYYAGGGGGDPAAAAAAGGGSSSVGEGGGSSTAQGEAAAGKGGGEEEGQGSWVPVWDSRYTAYYYFNAETQETVWTCPYGSSNTGGATTTAASNGDAASGGDAGEGGQEEEEEGQEEEEEEGEGEGEEGEE